MLADRGTIACVRDVVKFFKANPQALVLLIICVVLGLGTFLAVVIALLGSNGTTTGQPSGAVPAVYAAVDVPPAAARGLRFERAGEATVRVAKLA